MNRRRALTGISALAAWIMLGGQTPYRQWKRDGYGDLLLYTNNDDPGASWTGGLLAGQLLKMLPASGARVAVESTAEGLASAIAQRHGELAIVASKSSRMDASACSKVSSYSFHSERGTDTTLSGCLELAWGCKKWVVNQRRRRG